MPKVYAPSLEGLSAASALGDPTCLPALQTALHFEGLATVNNINEFLPQQPTSHENIAEAAYWTSEAESEGIV